VLEHKRRYTRASLRGLIEQSGLRIEYLGWASAAILPPAFLLRGLRRFRPAADGRADVFALPEPLNTMARGLYHIEAALASTTGLPFGVSLAAVLVR
jgi:hypothetical protein